MRKLIIYFRDVDQTPDEFNLDLDGDDNVINKDGMFSVLSQGNVYGYPIDTIKMYTLTEVND